MFFFFFTIKPPFWHSSFSENLHDPIWFALLLQDCRAYFDAFLIGIVFNLRSYGAISGPTHTPLPQLPNFSKWWFYQLVLLLQKKMLGFIYARINTCLNLYTFLVWAEIFCQMLLVASRCLNSLLFYFFTFCSYGDILFIASQTLMLFMYN